MTGTDPTAAGGPPSPKGFRLGTHRAIDPRETIERIRPHMAAMGITRVANVTGLDRIGIPVVMVCRPNSRSLAVAQGKGLDLDAAKASGLGESIEAYHAAWIADIRRQGRAGEQQTKQCEKGAAHHGLQMERRV